MSSWPSRPGPSFAAFGVDHAALWGVIAGALHVVPYAGSALTIVATGLAAFLQFETAGARCSSRSPSAPRQR